LREVLARVPRYNNLDAEEAADMVKEPIKMPADYPFSQEPTASAAKDATGGKEEPPQADGDHQPKKKGILKPKHSKKFDCSAVPKAIWNELKKSIPAGLGAAGGEWSRLYLKLNSLSLSRNTWKVYGVALKWYWKSCRFLGIKNLWPLSNEKKIGFVTWCVGMRGLTEGTLTNYLAGLSSISKMEEGMKNFWSEAPLTGARLKLWKNRIRFAWGP